MIVGSIGCGIHTSSDTLSWKMAHIECGSHVKAIQQV